ncbi:MAG: hypothetical protein WBA67_16480 [Jannaschia sp.]
MFLDRLLLPVLTDEDDLQDAWDRLRGRKPLPLDETEGHPLAREGLMALEDGAWRRIGALYAQQTADDRLHWIDVMANLWDLQRPMPRGAESAAALTVQGGVLARLGYRHRGTGRGHEIPEESFRRMEAAHRTGADILDRARAIDGLDCATLGMRALCANGLGDGDEIVALDRHMGHARERSLLADGIFLWCFSAKWGGSQEIMWQFVEDAAGDDPVWIALRMRARIEDWRWHEDMSPEPGARAAHVKLRTSADYREQMRAEQRAFLEGIADRQVSRARALWAHNQVGAAMATLVDWASARPHLEAIGANIGMPWFYVQDCEDPMQFLNRIRRRAKLPALFAAAP